jgi:hypothetical protein
MSIKDPLCLLAEQAREDQQRKAEIAARAAAAQRLNRLYRAWHESPGHHARGVASYSTQQYEEEFGEPPPATRAFCLVWARYLILLAQTLTADGWWQDVERLCCADAQDRGRLFTWHILQATKAGETERVAELLEQGNGLGNWFLRYGLYRELSTAADKEDAPPANPEPPGFQSPYTVRPPHWLVCGDKQVKVGPICYDLLEFMHGKAETLTEDAIAVLSPGPFHKTKTVLNQFLGRRGFAFHFRAGRDGKLRLVLTRYEKPNRAGKPNGKRGKRERK